MYMRTGLLVAAVLVATLRTAPAAAQEYYGVPVDDSGVAFLLDVSGSMEGKEEKVGGVSGSLVGRAIGNVRETAIGRSRVGRIVLDRAVSETTKMGSARRALMRALGSLRDGTSFTVITFGDEANEWPGGVRLSGKAATLFAQGWVGSLSAKGETPMAEALRHGFSARDVRTLFVVSDGRPTTGEVLGLVRQLQKSRGGSPMVINTVGIGADQDPELLCALATENGGVYVRDGTVACSYSPCPEDHGLVTYFPDGPRRHHYIHPSKICSTADNPKCTKKFVYDTMVSEARFQAPTRERGKLSNCQKLDLRIYDWMMLTRPIDVVLKLWGKGGVDPVTVAIDPDSYSATNYTRPGHRFHPGKITRTVRESGGFVIVETEGVGTGDEKLLNQEAGPLIFGNVDEDLTEGVRNRLSAKKTAKR